MAADPRPVPELTRQERVDLGVSRRLPRASSRANRLVFRLSRGRIGSRKRGIPIGLLTTTGRASGRPRTVPLMYLADGGRYLVVASNGGRAAPPAWQRNLEADPDAVFEPAGGRVEVRARVVDADEKRALWPRLVAHNPLWAHYQAATSREIAVVSLEAR